VKHLFTNPSYNGLSFFHRTQLYGLLSLPFLLNINGISSSIILFLFDSVYTRLTWPTVTVVCERTYGDILCNMRMIGDTIKSNARASDAGTAQVFHAERHIYSIIEL